MAKVSRRQTLGLGLGAGLSVTMLTGHEEAQAAPQNTTFSLLLVNDIYKMSDDKGRGGFAKLAAVVKQERARNVPMLFCHAGDTFSPSLMSGFDQGAHIVELTNMVKPDVFVPGNHEFDFGKETYLKRMGESNFPYFGANMRQADGSPIPGMKDSQLFTLGPVKVGVVGLVLTGVPGMSQPGDLKFGPELDALKAQTTALRQQGADIVVCVAHTDRDMDNQIVRSRLVDVLLTGHDHDLAIGYDGKTVMVESSEEGNFVTAIDFVATVAGEGQQRRVTWAPSFRVHDSSTIDPDPEVLAVVKRYEAALSKELDVEIGTSVGELDSRTATVRSQETAIGNLIADAIKESTGGELAITNGGGIRANKQYPAGVKLTRRDILSELPFGNSTSLVEVTGADIKAALENGVSQIEQRAGRFPQVSGLKFEVDSKAAVGSRVSNIQVNGAPIDMAKKYKVATNNFMVAGGDGYTPFTKGRVLIGTTDGKLMANEVMAFVRKKGTVDSKVEGRIVVR
ncbi:MAG TPA: bifunctional UDP-sugar hydrolase/5'-nucleotidase [Microvirga sp.]|jgi:2',3'-cyclic-nucleotide 2'-phosphodiesterase (5'-nucleotidase family)